MVERNVWKMEKDSNRIHKTGKKVDFLDFEQFSNSRKNTSGKENES